MNTWIFVSLLYHQWDSPQYIFKTLSEVSINSPPVRNRFFLLSVLIQIIISFVTAGMKTCLYDVVGVATQINTHTDCLIKNLFSYFSLSLFIVHDYSHRWGGLVRVGGQRGLEVVDDSADGLDVGVLGLPLVMAAVVSTLNNVHAATEVWLLVHHPAGGGARREERRG